MTFKLGPKTYSVAIRVTCVEDESNTSPLGVPQQPQLRWEDYAKAAREREDEIAARLDREKSFQPIVLLPKYHHPDWISPTLSTYTYVDRGTGQFSPWLSKYGSGS